MQIKCEERYREALAHAEKTDDKSLQQCIDKLKSWEPLYGGELVLTEYFAPLSFNFKIIDTAGKTLINGGLLYHGNPDQSHAITFDRSIGWQTHT